MKSILAILLILVLPVSLFCNTILVDITGSGQYTAIQPAINAASAGDTITILPGVYDAPISVAKNIVIIGSGYETTIITSTNNPTVTMSAGKIMWVAINSLGGDGISLKAGTLKNVVIRGCTGSGVYSREGLGTMTNCVLTDNAEYGIACYSMSGLLNVTNCISYNNGKEDFYQDYTFSEDRLSVSYSNGETNYYVNVGPGVIDLNPLFTSDTDIHLQLTSLCWDTGNTSMTDPDGTRSDMGYFGGTECPLYPVVKNIKIVPQENGEIQIQATGSANY